MRPWQILVFGVVPYIALAAFVVGHWWRWKYDQFGWTTRSSEVYEKRILRVASPLFHFGILFVIAGHVLGLLIPASWIDAIGVPEDAYHWMSKILGGVAALATIAGLVMLVYRRRSNRSVFRATTVMDKTMYVFLGLVILMGTTATIGVQWIGEGYEYRETISPWFRSLFTFQPSVELMDGVPWIFVVHILCAMALFVLWPFTRLVHVWSAPLGYLVRPYIVYRSRDPHRGSRRGRRGWEPLERPGSAADARRTRAGSK